VKEIKSGNQKGIMSEENYLVTCSCQHCDGNIEFDASLFQAGTMTTCPHCEMETALFIPKAPEKVVEKIPEKTAKIIERKEKTYHGGMEIKLEDIGGIFLALGILGGIAAIIAAFVAFNDNETGVGVDLLCVGVALIFASFVNQTLFRAGAEVIRLLKKLNGLKFSGEITQPIASDSSSHKCSACNAPVNSFDENCFACGAKFRK
jgi:hypothetical protein